MHSQQSGRYDWNDWNRGGNNNNWTDRNRDWNNNNNGNGRYSTGRVWTEDPWNLSPFAPYNPRPDSPPYASWPGGSVYGTSHRGYHQHNYQNVHDGHAHWLTPSPGPQASGPQVERTLNLINDWYRVYFGRSLHRWEARKWTSDLKRGMTREEIFATILSSADWYHRAGSSARSWIRATLASLGELDARALPSWLVQLNNLGGDRRALADQIVARYGVQPARRVRPSELARPDEWNDNRAERLRDQRQRQRRRQRRNR